MAEGATRPTKERDLTQRRQHRPPTRDHTFHPYAHIAVQAAHAQSQSWGSSSGLRYTVRASAPIDPRILADHAQTSSPIVDAIPSSLATRISRQSSVPMALASQTAWTPSPLS